MLNNSRTRLVLAVTVAAAMVALGVAAGPWPGRSESASSPATIEAPAAPAEGGFSGTPPAGGGIALLATTEASTAAALVSALGAGGCGANTLAILVASAWSVYVVGAPPAVNTTFPATLAAGTPFFVRCKESGGVQAFRYSVRLERLSGGRTFLIEQSGEVVLPDREHSTIHMDLGGTLFDSDVITIGSDVWQRGDVPVADLGLTPASFFDAVGGFTTGPQGGFVFDAASVSGLATTEETVNGVAAVRYELDSEQVGALLVGFVPEPNEQPPAISLWLAEDLGVPVRIVVLTADGSFRLEINVTDLNAPDISIVPPA